MPSFQDTALLHLRALTTNPGAEFRDGQLEAIRAETVNSTKPDDWQEDQLSLTDQDSTSLPSHKSLPTWAA